MGTDNVVQLGAPRGFSLGHRLIPSRLRDARRALRMTQEQLGKLANVTRQAISSYESGEKLPDPTTFRLLVDALRQPASFFNTDDRPVFGQFSPRFFRKTGPETIRKNDACAVLGRWFVQTAKYFDEYINYPAVSVPMTRAEDASGRYTAEEIEGAAESCRSGWGLGIGPISNVLALLESKGIAVCRYDMDGERIDAFSFWSGSRPFIFLASERESGARVRYDLAHELGHLVLHRWIEAQELRDPKTLKRIEWEANRFAAALLLPRKSFPYEVYTPRLEAFLDLKLRWGVSVQAMVYRCKDLDIIDDDQFTNLYKSISFRKWRAKEPLDDPAKIRIESPRMLGRAMKMLIESNAKHPSEVLVDLGISAELLAEFCNVPRETFSTDASPSADISLKENVAQLGSVVV